MHFKILGYTSDIYIPSKIFMERFGHHLFDKKFLIDYNDILAIIKVNNTVTVKFCSLSAIIRSCPPPNNIG